MIQSIHLRNCQSWEDGIISLSKGLNVIVADNNTGKSVIFKILKVTCNPSYYTPKEREKLIRHNADCAEVGYKFYDDSYCYVRITKKEVVYNYYNNQSAPITKQTTNEPPIELLDKLNVITESYSNYNANILDSDQPLLLVNSDNKSDYQLMQMLTNHQELERLSNNTTYKLSNYKQIYSKIKTQYERLDYQYNTLKYVDTNEMEREIELATRFIEVYNKVLSYKDILNNLSRLEPVKIDYNLVNPIVGRLTKIEQLSKMLAINLKPTPKVNVNLIHKIGTITKSLNTEVKPIPNINIDAITKIGALSKTLNTDIKYVPYVSDIVKSLEKLGDISDKLKPNNYNKLKILEPRLNTVQKINTRIIKMIALLDTNEKCKQKLKELEESVSEGYINNCPVYGTVKIKDGKCVLDYRSGK